jgi:polyribonucleotide 5'-hydroxyl-kinase
MAVPLALPGLNLPGLTSLPGLSSAPVSGAPSASVGTRTEDLPAHSEYRFEVAFNQTLHVKLVSGTAEIFGTELAPSTSTPYTFTGTKGAIYTYHGCKLELEGQADGYVAEETQVLTYANVHFALDKERDAVRTKMLANPGRPDTDASTIGPRVLIVGPENSGKTSLAKTLTAYAVKMGRQPIVVNLDPKQGMLSVPGSLSAAAFTGLMDVEEGWGSSPISGPSPIPVKMPLVYHFGLKDPDEGGGKIFKPLVTRMGLAVSARLSEDPETRVTGCIIDTPGSISSGKGGQYDSIQHIISEFSGVWSHHAHAHAHAMPIFCPCYL